MGHREPMDRLALETPQKAMDNLTLDAIDAQRAGMTYGKYKALHPDTMAANEARLAPSQRKKRKPVVYEFTCLYCGEKFMAGNPNAKYCSCACKNKRNEELFRRRRGIPERKKKQ